MSVEDIKKFVATEIGVDLAHKPYIVSYFQVLSCLHEPQVLVNCILETILTDKVIFVL